ncbi:hypothetical protein ACVRZD_02230 [Streptococcus hongkongensis]|nr:membrane protein [Streptococcus uberis]
MISIKLIPYKKWYVIMTLIFLILIYNQAILHVLFFDSHASDLDHLRGELIKLKYLKGLLSLNNSIFEFNFFQAFLLPLLTVILGYMYYYLKNRYCRYYLGRTDAYFKCIKMLKLRLTVVNLVTFFTLLLIIIITAILVDRFDYNGLKFYFNQNSVVSYFSKSAWHYLLYYFFVKTFAILTETVLFFYLIDYFNQFTKSALVYILYLWGSAPILYSFLPFYLVPISHIMITSYGDITLWQLIASYLPCFIVVSILQLKNKNEII